MYATFEYEGLEASDVVSNVHCPRRKDRRKEGRKGGRKIKTKGLKLG